MPEFDDDNKTIFTSDLDPEEKVAVASGEARGKRVAMAERSEHYGCIGNTDTVKYAKGAALVCGDCIGCEHHNPNSERAGEHCKLPENERCVKLGRN